jgi:hypothetical protein
MANEYIFPDEQDNNDKAKGGEVKNDELEIEIVDDTPPEDQGRKPLEEAVGDPTEDELKQYSEKVQDRIKKLTHARHDERREKETLKRERDELDRLARQAMAERDELRGQLGKGVEVISTQAKTMADSDIVSAKAKLKAAHEAFDTNAIVEASAELNAAQLRKQQAENIRYTPVQTQKTSVESAPTAQTQAPKLDERTSKWMSNNRWFGEGGDKAMTGYALGLHQELVEKHGEDFTRTPEYFSQIDTAIRRTFPDRFGGTKKPNSIVAPAGRTSAAGSRKVQLTQSQVAIAKRMGLTPQQYAAEVVKVEMDNE